jgi:CHAT domain-containing protein/Tfp pilus assembly protein PilF
MKSLIWMLLALVTCVATFHAASAAESVYRDPHQRFTLQIPEGWTSAPTNVGVNVSRGKAYASLIIMERSGRASDLVSFFSRQFEKQWANFTELKRGDSRFGGQAGAFAVFAGVNPKGGEEVLKIVAMATDERSYALLMGVPKDAIEGATWRDLARIEQSFAMGSPSQGYRLETLGTAALERGKPDEARDHLLSSLAMARELRDRDSERRLLGKLGRAYRALKDYDRATETYQQFLSLAQAAGDRQDEGIALGSLGIIYEALKDYNRAISAFRQALSIARQGQSRSNEASSLWHLGQIALDQEDYVQAIEFFSQALPIVRDLGDSPRQMEALLQLGKSHYFLADYGKAIDYLQQSLKLSRALGDKRGQGKALKNLGSVYYFLHDTKRAVGYYQQDLEIARELGDREREGQALGNLALAYNHLGEHRKAVEYYEQDLAIAREAKDRLTESQALSNLGNVYLDLRDHDRAAGYYQQSLALARAVGYRRGEGLTLTNLGRALYKAGNLPKAEEVQRQAITVLEALREKVGIVDAYNVSLFERHLQAYRFLQTTLIARNRLEAALEIAEQGRARALNELLWRRESSATAPRLAPEFPTLDEIREIARVHNATLVEYSFIPEELALFIWVVHPTGQVFFGQPDLISLQKSGLSLDELVGKARTALGVGGRGTRKTQKEGPALESEGAMELLYQMLIEPIADRLPADSGAPVIFIPQESLFMVSFPALRDRSGRYLVDKHTIQIVPSIQTLKLTRPRRVQGKAQGKPTLVVGNPTMPWISLGPGAPREQLDTLPGAEREALEVAKLLKTEAITGGRATKPEVLRRMRDASLIHLATHGLLDDLKGLGIPGAIALAPSAQDDGLLTAAEIQDLKLNAELVVLSACDTGRGRITGDGVIGLSRSFISAGVPSVVVSLWGVPDAPTADLMTAFYRHLQRDRNKAKALRQAMLETRGRYPAPRDWAAFTLVGEAD